MIEEIIHAIAGMGGMTWVELVAALVSTWAVWLTTRRAVWSCPIGLISVLLYAWVFVVAKLYSDALLQGLFGVMILYGWWHWTRHLDATGKVEPTPLPVARGARHLALGALGAVALGATMHYGTDAALPWLDAALTAASLVGQWWQSRRHIAAWWLWIVVDVVYVGEYVYKDLRITAVLYVLFVALAVLGLRNWQRARGGPRTTAGGAGTGRAHVRE